ncbi:MAG: DUF2520 domain-containing protein [Actinomycetota bacterium]|nr:DUF2520 domain-containing protein [Actinomycetota bacterium]
MKTSEKLDICVIGPGRLGMTLSYCFSTSKTENINLAAVSGRRIESVNNVKKILSGKNKKTLFFTNSSEAAKKANCILICTPDDAIKKVCEEIFVKRKISGEGKTVIHFSGLKGLDVLVAAKSSGASVCCIHPMKSFADYLDSANSIKDTLFGVTYDKKDKNAFFAVKNIVNFLQGKSVYVENDSKAVYHACACMASNYLVGLLNIVEKMGKEIGIKPEIFLEGILNLSQGTIDNIKKFGTNNSLTGPIARGDVGTIKSHLEKIEAKMRKEYSDVYKLLGHFTADIALENKWIDKNTYHEFLSLFVS